MSKPKVRRFDSTGIEEGTEVLEFNGPPGRSYDWTKHRWGPREKVMMPQTRDSLPSELGNTSHNMSKAEAEGFDKRVYNTKHRELAIERCFHVLRFRGHGFVFNVKR